MDGEKRVRSSPNPTPPNRDLVLQWGNRKRLRCVKKLNNNPPHHSCFKTTSSRSAAAASEAPEPQPAPRRPATHRERDSPMKTQTAAKSATSSPEKEDKYYSTRGSSSALVDDYAKFFATEGGGERGCAREDKNTGNGHGHGSHVWPKLFLSLSSKEKEEDFMAMKGCKLPQRPKKRPKLVQKSLLLVSPGAWLSDLCQERYEVREKKASKRRPRGLKAMGSMESESD